MTKDCLEMESLDLVVLGGMTIEIQVWQIYHICLEAGLIVVPRFIHYLKVGSFLVRMHNYESLA